MGVPGFFSWLIKNKNKLGSKYIIKETIDNVKYLMLDTNCLLHPCVNNIIEKYKLNELLIDENILLRDQLEEYIWNKIECYIVDIINKVNPENLLIAIDGVAPMGKILQQRQRRYKYLYDKHIKLHSIKDSDIKCIKLENGIELPEIPISSIELTPGTDYMERIHKKMQEFVKKLLLTKKINIIYSSYHEEGEGEHKILQFIKKNIDNKLSETIVIYGLDADLLFLSLGVGRNHNLYIMREKQIFNNKEVNLDDEIEYNYVEIKQLHNLIKNLGISTNDFIVLCYLIGNDFMPGLLTTDVKKGGLDKIFTAYDNLLTKLKINRTDENKNIKSNLLLKEDNEYIINDLILIELFKEILWTEKYIWKNINRENYNKNQNNNNNNFEEIKIQESNKEIEKINNMNKFKLGMSNNTNFLEKIEFNSDIEYYSYYLGIECLDYNIDKLIIIKMVKDYITTITWCINYYLKDCKSWSWGYNFMVAPLIKDIIKYYPKKIEIIKKKRELNPVEQLILAIPPHTYKYVLEKSIIDKLKKEKNTGFMFPDSFDIDINKELIYWKCQVRIPMVEYDQYINVIKKININNNKNL